MSDNLLMLLEMIEEVLEEQSKHSEADEIIATIKANFPELEVIDRSNTKRVIIDNTGGKRSQIMNLLRADPDPAKQRADKFGILPSGTKIELKAGARGGVRNLSERFEENIIIALNNGDDSEVDNPVSSEEYEGIQEIANEVANKSGIKARENWFKPGNGVVTDKYKKLANGKTRNPNPTPKTDISNKVEKDYRISVKKDGAQLLSGQADEVMSITSVVANQLNYTEIFKRLLIEQIELMGDKVAIDALEPSERGDLGRQIAQVLFSRDEFKERFLLEAMTGNERFTEPLPIANSLLIWNLAGNAHFEPAIANWVSNNYSNVKYGVRSRGQGRGLAARLEPYVKEFAAKSGEEGFVNEREMQIARAAQDIASLPPTPPIPKEIPTEVMVAAIEQFFAELKEDKFLTLLDAVGIDEEDYSSFDFTIRQNLSKTISEET